MARLLQINPVIRENTSTGRIMRELGEYAMDHGWESYIAYSRGRDGIPSHSSKLIPVGSKWDTFVHGLMTRLFDRHGLASSHATRALIREIQKIHPDVIQIHNIHGYFINYKLLFRYLSRCEIPVVWTTHDCWLYTGHCYHYDAVGCQKWQKCCEHCPQKTSFPASWVFDRSRKNFRDKRNAFTSCGKLTIVNISKWMQGEMQHSFLSGARFRLIPNGIDVGVFHPVKNSSVAEKYGIDLTRPIVLFVASIWSREKGLEDVNYLAGQLPKEVQVVMVGGLARNQKQTLCPRIMPINRTSDTAELAALFSTADVFVNPTYQDNYPTVNMEAQACGTPVVTYASGGSAETVSTLTGVVVPKGNVEGLSVAIIGILNEPDRFPRKTCREYAVRHFDKIAHWGEYLNLYETLINENSATR